MSELTWFKSINHQKTVQIEKNPQKSRWRKCEKLGRHVCSVMKLRNPGITIYYCYCIVIAIPILCTGFSILQTATYTLFNCVYIVYCCGAFSTIQLMISTTTDVLMSAKYHATSFTCHGFLYLPKVNKIKVSKHLMRIY